MSKPEAFYRQIGQNIRARRNELGLSQEGLAKAVGLKRPSMSNIEKGRQNLLLHTFCEIAETLDVPVGALLPQRPESEPVQLPDLTSYSKEVQEFVEAAIKPAGKDEKNGHQET